MEEKKRLNWLALIRKIALILAFASIFVIALQYFLLFYHCTHIRGFHVAEMGDRSQNRDEFRVAMFSDCGMRMNVVRLMADDMRRNFYPDFVVFLGDMNRKPSPSEWYYATNVLHKEFKGIPLYGTPGNHDIKNEEDKLMFLWMFSWDRCWVLGDTLFIKIDSADQVISDEQFQQLESALAYYQGKVRRRVVMTHVPPVAPSGVKRHTIPPEQSARLQGILEKYNVDLLVCGHVHVFYDTANPRPGYPPLSFGKTRLVILPSSGQSTRDNLDTRLGYARFLFKKDGSIQVEPVMLTSDDSFEAFYYWLYFWGKYHFRILVTFASLLILWLIAFFVAHIAEKRHRKDA